MIRITSKREGFRRCGVAHAATPTDHPDKAFTAAELKRLQAEPMLEVEVIQAAPKPPATRTTKKAAKKKAVAKKTAQGVR